jgi:hypothetical protein
LDHVGGLLLVREDRLEIVLCEAARLRAGQKRPRDLLSAM